MEEEFSKSKLNEERNGIESEKYKSRKQKWEYERGVRIGDTFKTIFVDKHLYNVRGKEKERGGEKKDKRLSRIIAHKR